MAHLNMLKKWMIVLGTLVLSVGVVYSFYRPSEAEKEELIIQLVTSGLQQAHFAPQAFDNSFSERMFDFYLESLDPGKRFFLAADVEGWAAYRNDLDNAVLTSDYTFFDSTYETLMMRIGQTKSHYQEILAEPFDFTVEEYIETDPSKLAYATTTEEQKEYWRQYLKYRTMLRVDDLLERQGDSLSLEEIEVKARKKVLKSHDDWYDRMDEMERKDWHAVYINSITAVFDPHTQYFPPYDQDAFEIQMSGQLEGIGAQLVSKDGFVEVTRIVSGSPSWRMGELKVGDQILKVAQADEEPVDVVDMRIEDVVQLIRGPKGTEVRLTLRKLNGTMTEISIIRDVVVLEETFARSAVIEHDGDKYGYIRLPKFYLSFDGSGRDCGEDVKNELLKLQKEDIEGVVFDLRNNGGGSLQGAIDIAGLFIDQGPVVQVKAKGQSPVVLQDEAKGVIYDGPLVVLVNAFSASASEILAGALQDYDRAVVVGAAHTFGKGTVQNVFEFDDLVRGQADALKPLGALKLTIQKFYRIDGTTTQLRGVTPDVVLPNSYNLVDFGEKELEFPLAWDEIKPADYATVGSVGDRMEQIKAKSGKRVGKNKTFQLIQGEALWLEEQDDFSQFPLQLEAYQKLLADWEDKSEKFKAIDEFKADFTATELVMATAERDTVQLEKTRRFQERLTKDVELAEALLIVDDLD
ncbi:carboxy terminal-processing peptidase [Cryomorphaceae bacterium]|nr:carboxy terminal-processing peptidase [Cryomorphaceae bacterium]